MVDVLTTCKNVLTNNWLSANTDSVTPTIDLVVNRKLIDLANGDVILLYELDEPIDPFGIGAQEWAHLPTVSIDIRTTNQRTAITSIRAHLIKMKDEVLRIMKANVSNPDSDFCLAVIRRRKDLSDKSIGIGRMVIDVQFRKYG